MRHFTKILDRPIRACIAESLLPLYFGIIGVLGAMAFIACTASPALAKEYRYKFPNGKELLMDPKSGVYLENSARGVTKLQNLDLKGKLTLFPTSSREQGSVELSQSRPFKVYHSFAENPQGADKVLVAVDDELYTITQDGEVNHIGRDLLETSSQYWRGGPVRSAPLQVGGKKYLGFFIGDPRNRRGKVDAYILDREDRVSYLGSRDNPGLLEDSYDPTSDLSELYYKATGQRPPPSHPRSDVAQTENQQSLGDDRSHGDHQKLEGGGTHETAEETFEHNGKKYRLVSDEGADSTSVVRLSDGKMVRFCNQSFPPKARWMSVQNGILNLKGCSRQVDLDAFDAEARFQSRKAPVVQNSEGQEIDPFEDIKRYKDLTAEVRSNPEFGSGLLSDADLKAIRLSLISEGSLAVTGEPGSGKSETVNTAIRYAVEGKIPEFPRTWKVLDLNAASLGAGTSLVGKTEERVAALRAYASEIPTIFRGDEIHTWVGVGTSKSNPTDVLEQLKPDLADGTLKIWATSTDGEYDQYFGGNEALKQRLVKHPHHEPSGEELKKILKAWAKKTGRPELSDEVADLVIRTSNEMDAIDAQPRKGLKLLKRVYGQLGLKQVFDQAPQASHVQAAAIDLYHPPAYVFDRAQAKGVLERLPQQLDADIVGKEQLKNLSIRLTKQVIAGTRSPEGPAAKVLETGPKGLGKTLFPKILGKALDRPVYVVQLSSYAKGKTPDDLLTEITSALRKNAFSIIVLDEIEKASEDIQNALLPVLNEGTFSFKETSLSGRKQVVRVSARNAMFYATTNAGSSYIMNQARAGSPIVPEELNQALLRDGLSEPLVDRVHWVASLPPSKDEFREILALKARSFLKEQEKRHHVSLSLENEKQFLDDMVKNHYSVEKSGRDVNRLVEESIQDAVTEAALDDKLVAGKKLKIRYHPPSKQKGKAAPSCGALFSILSHP